MIELNVWATGRFNEKRLPLAVENGVVTFWTRLGGKRTCTVAAWEEWAE